MALLGVAFAARGARQGAWPASAARPGVALIVGPVVGGAIAQGLAWRWIFWINLPIAAIVIPRWRRAGSTRASDQARRSTFPDPALVAGSALGLAWGLMRGNNAGWSSLEVVATLGAGLLLAAAFVGWERRRARADVAHAASSARRPSHRASHRPSSSSASMYGVLFFLPQFLQIAPGFWAVRRRRAVVAVDRDAVRGGAIRRQTGQPVRRTPPCRRWPRRAGARHGVDRADRRAGPRLCAPRRAADPDRRRRVAGDSRRADRRPEFGRGGEIGKASGAFNMVRYLGGVFGIAALVGVFSGTGGVESAVTFGTGFAAAIKVAAALSLLGAVAGCWLPTRRRMPPHRRRERLTQAPPDIPPAIGRPAGRRARQPPPWRPSAPARSAGRGGARTASPKK